MSRQTINHNRTTYPSDLTDAQWDRLQAYLPKAKGGRTGRRRKHPLRELVNAMLYQLRTGCAWRFLPHDFPPWARVYNLFRRWRDDGTFEHVQLCLLEEVRRQQGRQVSPSAAIVYSQSVKAGET